ncbi:MAG: hypothetical protein GXY58_06515 [Planctomycetaceae bacterium]|nr:hypothetical protein [Planctomycetaceae bacterium]
MPDRLISDIIDLPDRVRKGDFVLNLSKGVTESENSVLSASVLFPTRQHVSIEVTFRDLCAPRELSS